MPKLCNQGENYIARCLLDDLTIAGTLYVGLYTQASPEPIEATTLEDMVALEIDQSPALGYERKALVKNTNWGVAADLATGDQQTWTSTGIWGAAVDGYFICTVETGFAGGYLLVIEAFASSYLLVDTDVLRVIPKITLE